MKKKVKIDETKIYVAVLVLIFVAAIIISVARMGADRGEPVPTPAPTAQTGDVNAAGGGDGRNEPEDTQEPEDTHEPAASQEPSHTAAPATTPTPAPTPSPTPTPTPAPTPTPTPAADAQGSFSSATGLGIELVVDWSASPAGEGSRSLTFSVSLNSYSLYTSALPGALILTVGSDSYEFDTPAVSYNGHTLLTTPFATKTVTVPAGSVNVSAEWYYRGTYAGVYLESITASGTAN